MTNSDKLSDDYSDEEVLRHFQEAVRDMLRSWREDKPDRAHAKPP